MKTKLTLFFILLLTIVITSCSQEITCPETILPEGEVLANPINTLNLYRCEGKLEIVECPFGLSGGKFTRCYLNVEKSAWKTCSTGWIQHVQELRELVNYEYKCGDYFCYPDTDYCRLHGLVNNPPVDRNEVCG